MQNSVRIISLNRYHLVKMEKKEINAKTCARNVQEKRKFQKTLCSLVLIGWIALHVLVVVSALQHGTVGTIVPPTTTSSKASSSPASTPHPHKTDSTTDHGSKAHKKIETANEPKSYVKF